MGGYNQDKPGGPGNRHRHYTFGIDRAVTPDIGLILRLPVRVSRRKGRATMASIPRVGNVGAASDKPPGLASARSSAMSPGARPQHRPDAESAHTVAVQPQKNAVSARGWMVIETLQGSPEQISVVLQDDQPRSFSKLARANLPRTTVATLVAECLQFQDTRDKTVLLDDDRVFRLVGIPILGPGGGIFAVAVWSANALEPLPRIPVVGAVEWTPSGLVTGNPAAEYLLRPPNELPQGRNIPELLASFERWEDRLSFLEMFNFSDLPADQWTGLASKHYEDGTYHQLHIAARAVGAGKRRRVRAIVCDVTSSDIPRATDMSLAVLRAMPIPAGRALALVDLGSAFVHEWLTNDCRLAGWRHHNPHYDDDGRAQVAAVCRSLARGEQDRATLDARVRFSASDDWIHIRGLWTRMTSGPRPQAILDITPISPNPPPLISGCGLCYDLAHPE